MRRPDGVIIGVDLLRFASALMVVLFHLAYWIRIPQFTPGRIAGDHHFIFSWAEGTATVGRIGVQIFFVISGFVIAYSARKSDTVSFLRSRILRLAPAAWLCASITLAVALLVDTRSPFELVKAWGRSVLFYPAGNYIDGVYWTLGIECAFYAIVLALIAFGMLRHLEKLFILIATVSALFCLTVLVLRPELRDLISNRYLQIALVVNGCEFAVGVFLWGLLFEGVSRLRMAGLAIGLVGGSIEIWHWVVRPADAPIALGIWLASVAAIAASVILNDSIKAMIGDRGMSLMRIAGLATYPLYLIHDLVGAALMKQLAVIGVPNNEALAIAVLAMIGLACIIAVHLEPIIRVALKSATSVIEQGVRHARVR